MARKVAVLCVAEKSAYRALPDLDLWDRKRDAAKYQGPHPIVAHPPCAQWSRLRAFSRVDLAEKALGPLTIALARRYGGVVEQPAGSALFAGLPVAGRSDAWGFTHVLDQSWFGYPARKRTLLYICGVLPDALPSYPLILGGGHRLVESMSSAERSHTVVDLAAWLVQIARLSTPCPCVLC